MEEELRRQLVTTAHALHSRGWVANHDGNLSARLGDSGDLLCSPTAVSKADIDLSMLIVVDPSGAVTQGSRRAFSELRLHRVAYGARPDIGVVLHAHPPTATGFSVAGVGLGHPFMAEPVVTLGPQIPTVPYSLPGSEALDRALADALGVADVVLLERHGVIAVGGGFEQALLRLELVEHLAKISLVAHQLGGVRALPDADVQALSKRGRPASEPSFGQAPVRQQTAATTRPRPDVGGLVGQALRRFE